MGWIDPGGDRSRDWCMGGYHIISSISLCLCFVGPAKKSRIPDEATNLMTAYHEAGHTLVAFYTKEATPPHKVTIVPRGMSLGHVSLTLITLASVAILCLKQ